MRLFALLLMVACAKEELPPPVIKPVLFQSGSTEFIEQGDDEATLARAAKILETTEFHLVVVGLADAEGDPEANKVLSLQRADRVADLLRAKTKVPAARIKTYALGERLATGDNLLERKVEFVFYRDNGRTLQQVVDDARALRNDEQRKAAGGDEGKRGKGK